MGNACPVPPLPAKICQFDRYIGRKRHLVDAPVGVDVIVEKVELVVGVDGTRLQDEPRPGEVDGGLDREIEPVEERQSPLIGFFQYNTGSAEFTTHVGQLLSEEDDLV